MTGRRRFLSMNTAAINSQGGDHELSGRSRAQPRRKLALAHSGFYLLTGVWPMLSPKTFQAVTGPKVDFWLVNTAGALIAAIGAALGLAALHRRVTPEIKLLAIGSALGLTAIDVIYVARRRISPVYLLDAAAETALIAAWVAAGRGGAR